MEYNPLEEPLYLDGMKFKLNANGITLRILGHDIQTVTTDTWLGAKLL